MWEVDGGEVRRGRNFDKRSGWMEEKSVCKVAEVKRRRQMLLMLMEAFESENA
jgi:hypothetical protein